MKTKRFFMMTALISLSVFLLVGCGTQKNNTTETSNGAETHGPESSAGTNNESGADKNTGTE